MNIQELVQKGRENDASDIHLVYGLPPKYRLNGSISNMSEQPLTENDCNEFAAELAGDAFTILEKTGQLDLAITVNGNRIRVNLFRQMGHYSVAMRLLSENMPRLEELGLPVAISGFAELKRGIVLVTGETGSGKSTTLAAIIDRINQNRYAHILTLEDPVEYIYKPARCIINQREIGRDTLSYADGLKAALREDPDVILIGEMRDLETIEIALTAAETGHLVFATLHTGSAPDSIDRITDVFPASRQQQIRMQLSMTLKAVIAQQLLPRCDTPGRVCACEIMTVTAAIKNLIREGKTPQIVNTVATSAAEGNITMDNALIRLFKERKITGATAVSAAHDTDYVKKNTAFS